MMSKEPIAATQGTKVAVEAVDPSPATFPFRYDRRLHSGACQFLKMVIVGLVLFIPRLIILVVAFFNLWLTSALMLCCTHDETMQRYPLRRPIGRFLLRCWSRLILLSMGYWWISVSDKRSKEDRKNPAPIIAANHVSFVDAFYFAYSDSPMAVAKAEILKAPIVGTITRATQTIGVSRESAEARRRVTEVIDNRTRWDITQPPEVIKKYGHFPPLLIFPEATCTNGSSVIQFKGGAFHPLMPVQPVTLDYHQKHLDVSWVGGLSVPLTIIRMMCQVYNNLEVCYLPIEHPPTTSLSAAGSTTIVEGQEATLFAEQVRAKIAAQLNVPLSNHNFLDVLLMREVHILNLPQSAVNVGMGTYPHGLDAAKKKLRDFAALDKDGDGLLDEAEFAQMLGLTVGPPEAQASASSPSDAGSEDEDDANSSVIEALLSKWDTDGDGKINFREFLLFGACLKARHIVRGTRAAANQGGDSSESSLENITANAEEGEELRHAFSLCFGAFDLDCSGQVHKNDFLGSLSRIAPRVNPDEAAALFAKVDSDHDDIVTMPEYLAFCEVHPWLMMTFLDAVVAAEPDLLAPEDSADIQLGSRQNSFMTQTASPSATQAHGVGVFSPAFGDTVSSQFHGEEHTEPV